MSEQDVITGQAPIRYAKALLELAKESKSLKKVEKDLATFKKAYANSADLQRLATSPAFATEDKVNGLVVLAKKAKLSPLTTQFIGTVAGNRRAGELPSIIAAFSKLVALERGSQVAKVTSAKKLTAAELTSLKSNLKKSLGHAVDVETSVDPELLGGFVVAIGSRLYDSSLKSKLEDLRLALKEA